MSDTTSTGTGQAPESGATLVADKPAEKKAAIIGRSPGQLAWLRLRRDRVGVFSLGIVLVFFVVSMLAPLVELIYGYGPTTNNSHLLNEDSLPLGYLGGITFSSDNASNHMHILGVQPGTGRDMFMQLVYGARTSLLISLSATVISLVIGVVIGIVAAYVGGWIDSFLNWFTDYMLAFPFLIFAFAAIPIVNTWLADEKGEVSETSRIWTIIVIFSVFGWMGTARLVRGQVLSLREREYVEAARAAGAGVNHILFRQLLPNLWAPILVTFSLSVPATVTGEAALSFLGIGVVEPTPDWGRMINDSVAWYREQPMYMLIPGISIFILVLAFNLFGDALRDALDPKSTK
ncbi:peptide ABC transporter permease [Longispora fulva]|uniref:Peptide/nickel transport system permease protein n=1 Tax=Longispora fulva TaxID=619741 RepID=A0A8J7GJS3_9ACTN|nr:ABC transporter permease [Longispora fulva]MBG6138865.1 peptide/nickel transport system permease protein [Longispora fulva]GIG58358.1 peptide ABC transporter permease [Longispora fulva]